MKKYSIIILILCSWAMSLFAISCSDQESKPQPFLEIKKDTVVFAQEAANTSIVVNTNIAWQASVPSSGNWCTVQGADDLLSISVEKNTGRDLRETDIVVKGEGLEQKVHVKQLGEQPDISTDMYRIWKPVCGSILYLILRPVKLFFPWMLPASLCTTTWLSECMPETAEMHFTVLPVIWNF